MSPVGAGPGFGDAGEADEPAPGLSVSQLAERTGVGVPSIHHYRRLGLLPAPRQVAPNRFLYDQRHVEALQVIRVLRERRGLSLAVIRELLPGLLSAGDSGAPAGSRLDAVLAEAAAGESEQDEVRLRLLEAARGAFGSRGYEAVNVEELCQEAGIAKGSFYRYFASKDAVFVAAVASVPALVAARLSAGQLSAGQVGRGADLAAALRDALSPVVPLLLEAALRAGQGAAGAPVVRHVLEELAEVVEREEGGAGRGRELVRAAVLGEVAELLGFGSVEAAPRGT
ncbi:TetR family transcriptional regulator [Aciditerrimonas ferrireducens]|uniref:TetR family transcriptional regulator n=1 Tax=Aciditerrimonas ferrireducens TaxID=667306 RepID=UPI0020043354|nr:TetR family transcriptional regulator [Aciditerrimonas ferrireducens]MCK4176608.1 TetR family transcriptional regulator [Aciditerrimonas ferrireducens]